MCGLEGGHEQVVGLEAVVAGGGHDHDAGAPGVLDRAGQRVDLPRLEGDGAVGQGDDPDVHAAGVAVLDDPVEGGDDLGDVDAAVAGADLHVEQLGLGGDAGELAGPRVLAVDQSASRPAMMPAMWVPCPNSSR